MGKARMFFLITRPWSFSMTVISVILGVVLSVTCAGVINWQYTLLTVAGLVLVHGATNAINDYFDVKHKVDTPESATAQYREHFIITGQLRPREVVIFSIVLYAAAVVTGIFFVFIRGWPIVLFAGIGGLTSYFYTGGPVRFKHIALGEAAVFLMWGPLMVFASYFIQTGSFDYAGTVLLISIPQGLWVFLVLLANNIKDAAHDREIGVKTIANLFPRRGAHVLFSALIVLVYVITGLEIAAGLLPLSAFAVYASFPLILPLIRSFGGEKSVPPDADPRTARVGMVFGVLLILSLIVSHVFR